MPWLKAVPCFSHGRGKPEYRFLGDAPTPTLIEEIQDDMHREIGDPDNYRATQFEVVDSPPPEILAMELRKAEVGFESAKRWLEKVMQMAQKEG